MTHNRVAHAQRALLALVSVIVVILLAIGLMGSSVPPHALERSIVLTAPSPTATPTQSATTAPTATATPLPTATLARRAYLDTAQPKIAPTTFLPGQGPTLPGELIYSGRRLDFYAGSGTFSDDEIVDLAIKAEHALSYVQRRFAEQLSERVSVGIYARSLAPGPGTRGIAYTYGRTNVRIYYNAGEDRHKALVILAHELGHALQAEAYGREEQSRADIVLLEGLATWIAGEYWLTLFDETSFHSRARTLYQAGYRGNLASLGYGSSDVAYEMWAGFVDYLTRTYGWDKFNLLYANGRGRAPGSANYEGIYGKSFQELAAEYYDTLK
jgi:hypothetical protein